ncbi:uncharacterized protein B0H18DRAFT_1124525 [Fomitopsis serialis]|uniref:uncharacterized protein n=1 Tax=Fomitopsis serialis TaxID=139415 RepID=UPI0020081D10|nr:uncharacterized protein B0H18DRAFT_1124525 [Neoantrodia serialis]KAH9915982.1 hypothetical protein B0H18DRAFT_1124525 [Neoantrodia serialis]
MKNGRFEQSSVPKRSHKRKAKTAPPIIPLPRLQTTPLSGPVLEIDVLPIPTMEERIGLTWVVDNRPRHQLACSTLVKLRTSTQLSGVGRLAQIVTLRKHWATFSITGSQVTCSLRVPIPWTRLSALESHAHTKHYPNLPSTPRPHLAFRSLPPFLNDLESPYEFDTWDDEQPGAEASLTQITNAARKRRPRTEKTATTPEPNNDTEDDTNAPRQSTITDEMDEGTEWEGEK